MKKKTESQMDDLVSRIGELAKITKELAREAVPTIFDRGRCHLEDTMPRFKAHRTLP